MSLLAVKGNREVKIDAHEQESFEKNGYIVYDRETLKKVTVDAEDKTALLLLKIDTLEQENASLKAQLGGDKLSKDELKEIATGLGIKFTTRTTVDELEALIAAHNSDENINEK